MCAFVSVDTHLDQMLMCEFHLHILAVQVGAGELYGLSDFVLGCDGGGGASCCLYAASESVQVIRGGTQLKTST